MCQITRVFIFGGESFDFGHECCVGGVEQGDSGSDFLDHRLFIGGGMSQVVEIALEFLILDGFSSRGRLVGVRVSRHGGTRSYGGTCAAELDCPV